MVATLEKWPISSFGPYQTVAMISATDASASENHPVQTNRGRSVRPIFLPLHCTKSAPEGAQITVLHCHRRSTVFSSSLNWDRPYRFLSSFDFQSKIGTSYP